MPLPEPKGPLVGEIRVMSQYGIVKFSAPFITREGRKRINDWINHAYSDKIKNNGWYVSIVWY